MDCKTIILYGNQNACDKAQALLENLPEVKRADKISHNEIRLLLHDPLHEKSLIPLLADSGISGFRLTSFRHP